MLAHIVGAFSVFLSLLKVGILGCVEKGITPLIGQLMGVLTGVFLVLFF
jgi:hypothetical protein